MSTQDRSDRHAAESDTLALIREVEQDVQRDLSRQLERERQQLQQRRRADAERGALDARSLFLLAR